MSIAAAPPEEQRRTHVSEGWQAGPHGELLIGGLAVRRLAARAGSTPFFAYDRAAIRDRVDSVRAALPSDVHLSYAVKANPMPAVLHHLAGLVDGFDVASAIELRHALDTGVPADAVSFAGPGKRDGELQQAIAAGVLIELESESELDRVRIASDSLGIRARVALRVNPDFAVRGAGMRMGGGPQQFGIDSERVPEVLGRLAAEQFDFHGFHIFAGSQNLNAESLCQAQRRTVELVLSLAAAAPAEVRYLNLGGGFGIPYAGRDRPLELELVGEQLESLLAELVRPRLPAARVVDRKQSRGRTYLVVDGGLHHQLAASGNFGQAIRRNYPIAVANRFDSPATETVTVVGCLCTPLDLLGDEVSLPAAEVGDLIAIFQAGAYGLTASPNGFLSQSPAVELLV
ncbi:MAG TPA: alanine racemase [Jatrophihabitans sp.]|nr:alanine racemase [Jatrophihabitans sp.]